jgi:transglutaminase-like putative cysteine protease
MTRASTGFRQALPLPLVTVATTWFMMLSWKGFAVRGGSYLGPLMLVALVVALAGVALRLSPMPRRLAAVVQVLVVAALVWILLGGVPWAPLSSTGDIADSVSAGWNSAQAYASPVPSNVPGIESMMIPAGALSLLVVDFFASWLRRVSLAGLPLLAVYCVPISLLGGGVTWPIFVIAAAGFLLMLVLQESEHVARWGRPLGSAGNNDPQGFGVSNGASRATATSVGTVSVVLAIVLPIFVPTLHLGSLGLFGPGGSGDAVKVINPITDMRRDLNRGKDVPLLEIKTDDPDPSYLRLAALTVFNGVEWSTGNRSIISNQLADGLILPEPGLSASVVEQTHQYTVHATSDFDSTWLPTMFPATEVLASGDWHYDITTMDFISGNSHTNTSGLTWSMTGEKPQYSAYSMVNSLQAPTPIQTADTAIPSGLPPIVGQLANKVTRGAINRYQRVVMLQRWFRDTGGFRYSLATSPGDGYSALESFLTKGNGGRVGYCEQFASAFAVMARTLSIPARVAVGFLQPTKAANGDWVYSAHDLHAWPEVYFQGSGWVRFEPTPGSRAGSVPPYTVGNIVKPPKPSDGVTTRRVIPTAKTASTASTPHNKTTSSTSSGGVHVPWLTFLAILVVLALLVALAFVPGVVRRARRRRRLAGGVEEAWIELRDSAIDLGVSWPGGRSPHETGRQLVGWFGPEPDGAPQVRPPRGQGLAPGAEDALDRIVLTLERLRYSRHGSDVPGSLADDVLTCIAAIEHGCTRRALRRAAWLPRSLFVTRDRMADVSRDRAPEAVTPSGLVDHVG